MLSSNTISCITIFRLYFNRIGNKRSKTQQMPKMSTASLVLQWNKHPKSNIEFQKKPPSCSKIAWHFRMHFLGVFICYLLLRRWYVHNLWQETFDFSGIHLCRVFFSSFISLVECCESQLCTENAKMVAHRI